MRKLFGVKDALLALIAGMVSTVYAYLKSYEVGHVNNMPFIVYQLHLNKKAMTNIFTSK